MMSVQDFITGLLTRIGQAKGESPEVLDPRSGYDLWAPTYDADEESNPILGAERAALERLLPSLRDKSVLDVACGTGYYTMRALRAGARRTIGVDLSTGMLRQAQEKAAGCPFPLALLQSDQGVLPLAPRSFDVVIHALGAGYAPDLRPIAEELARVLRLGGVAFVSEVHPDGMRRGWRRTFVRRRGNSRRQVALISFLHQLQDYRTAFGEAGLSVTKVVEPQVDETVRPFFAAAGALERYERYHGHPLLVVFELRHAGRSR